MLMLILLLILNGVLGIFLIRQRRYTIASGERMAVGPMHVSQYRIVTAAPELSIARGGLRGAGARLGQTPARHAALPVDEDTGGYVVMIRNGTERPGQCYPIGRRRLIVGRDANADVPCHDLQVSRRHASLWKLGEYFFVRDELSANGLRVNGRRVTQQTLIDNDVISIGPVQMVFHTGHPIPPRREGQAVSGHGRQTGKRGR